MQTLSWKRARDEGNVAAWCKQGMETGFQTRGTGTGIWTRDQDWLGLASLLGRDALPAFPLPALRSEGRRQRRQAAAVALPLSFKASPALFSFLPSSPSPWIGRAESFETF